MTTATLDEFLTPQRMRCIECGAEGVVYPTRRVTPDGLHRVSHGDALVCPKCSPSWLGDFLLFRLDAERAEHGLPPIAERVEVTS